MNPLKLSPAAQLFWGSVIRHVLTGLGGALVAHGYVTQSGATAYEEELVGVLLNGAVMAWANRVHYWQQIRLLVALMHGSTATTQQDVTNIIAAKQAIDMPLPAVLTADHAVPVAKVD